MEIIPALDLMAGGIVRLRKGEQNNVIRYDHIGEPLEVAKSWNQQGANRLHIIDLDATFGRGENSETVLEVSKKTEIPVQFGGGIRSYEKASWFLESGINRIILGSLAVKQPGKVYDLVSKYGSDRVAVALDYRNGYVVYRGWKKNSKLTLDEALSGHLDGGVRVFLVTSTERDGTLEGPDLSTLKRLAEFDEARIIAAGGISSIRDILRLKKTGIEAVVVGRAIYENCFTISEALEVV